LAAAIAWKSTRRRSEKLAPLRPAPARLLLKVGILANTFESEFGSLAGGHVHFIEVAKRWTDVDVAVFAPEIARGTIERELPRATFVAMPSGDGKIRNRQLRNLYRTLAGLRRRHVLRKCDVLIASSHFLPDVVPALLASPKRTIVSIHHILTEPKTRAGRKLPNIITAAFQSVAFSFIRTFAAAVFVYTPDVAERAGVDPRTTRVFLMSNGANAPIEATEAAAQQRLGAVYLGRLVPTKGVEDVLRAWALLVRRGVVSELTIVGAAAPEYRASLQSLAAKLKIASTVIFLGNVSETEKSRLLRSARVFAFGSKEEGWGIVLAEAMRHGLPCLTYDLPAFRDIFTRGRISVAMGDIDAFADRLERFLSDDTFQSQMASEALDLASSFTWERAAGLEFEALEAIVDGA
jgi:glycosyltransferase involved in cell wall biosynthesis